MNYEKIGNSDLEVSELSFGCMSLEVDQGQDQVIDLLRKAYEAGINFFDTADLYDKGFNEAVVGKALTPFRDEVLISTKVGNEWRENGSGWDWNPSKEHILTGVNESLRRLQTDHIDLYMLHGGTIEDPIDEAIEAFDQLKKQGKIRAYGISSIRPNTIREWIKRSDMDCVMMQYSLLDRRPEEEALDLLHENGISVITRGTLAKGMLIDKPAEDYLGYSADQIQQMKAALDKTGHPLAGAIKYVQQHPAVASVVAGMRTEEQLQELTEANAINLSEEEIANLGNTLSANTYTKHR
ncbi:MAG TPA: oxidoreductase [Balneolaceae bacterium]|nr:oxidoreductase [Balneolaceae bacterium]